MHWEVPLNPQFFEKFLMNFGQVARNTNFIPKYSEYNQLLKNNFQRRFDLNVEVIVLKIYKFDHHPKNPHLKK